MHLLFKQCGTVHENDNCVKFKLRPLQGCLFGMWAGGKVVVWTRAGPETNCYEGVLF